jgi:preprotein translocase subunit SecA
MAQASRMIALRTIDFFWQEHLELMDNERDSVRLRAYGQMDPLVEYKNEANKQFRILSQTVETNIIQNILNFSVKPVGANNHSPEMNPVSQKSAVDYGKVDRNAPCPCGAKKSDGRSIKYKNCHGK